LQPRRGFGCEHHLDLLRQFLRDLALQRQQVARLAVIRLRELLRAVGELDQVHGDADPLAAAPHAAEHRVVHAQLAPDALHRLRLALVLLRARARDHHQPLRRQRPSWAISSSASPSDR
jgi:hypothetical protein